MITDSRASQFGGSWPGRLAWAGTLVVVLSCLGPVWGNWSRSVVAPFGGIDAMLQLGILEWTARHWTVPGVWFSPPIFFPVPDKLHQHLKKFISSDRFGQKSIKTGFLTFFSITRQW